MGAKRPRYAAIWVAAAAIASAPALATDYTTPKTPPSSTTDFILQPGDAYVSNDGRFRLLYQQDGNLVLYQGSEALWDSDTYIGGRHKQRDYGYAPGYAKFQGDGNLVVYHFFLDRPALPVAVWESKTWKYPQSTLDVQNDGNVVITAPNGRVRWASGTCCR